MLIWSNSSCLVLNHMDRSQKSPYGPKTPQDQNAHKSLVGKIMADFNKYFWVPKFSFIDVYKFKGANTCNKI